MLCRVVSNYKHEIPSLISSIERRAEATPSKGSVTFSTVHKAKGLEFDQLILADDFLDFFEEGEPANDATVKPEEVNIAYVAVTRAIRALSMPSDMIKWLGSDVVKHAPSALSAPHVAPALMPSTPSPVVISPQESHFNLPVKRGEWSSMPARTVEMVHLDMTLEDARSMLTAMAVHMAVSHKGAVDGGVAFGRCERAFERLVESIVSSGHEVSVKEVVSHAKNLAGSILSPVHSSKGIKPAKVSKSTRNPSKDRVDHLNSAFPRR